jgi:hypothetical protein
MELDNGASIVKGNFPRIAAYFYCVTGIKWDVDGNGSFEPESDIILKATPPSALREIMIYNSGFQNVHEPKSVLQIYAKDSQGKSYMWAGHY